MRTQITVVGAWGYVGQEIARLGVALGHPVVGLDRRIEPLSEPWTHGVRWVEAHGEAYGEAPGESWRARAMRGSRAVVIALDDGQEDHAERVGELARACADEGVWRVVYLSRGDASLGWPSALVERALQAEAKLHELLTAPSRAVILRASLAYDEQRRPLPQALERGLGPGATLEQVAQAQPVRMELVAMAALRAALEPERAGVLSWQEVAQLGDAMMIQ